MCIIAIKKAGISLPEEKTLKTMFENKPDGAGFMYAYQGVVKIEKGFMTYGDFKSAIEQLSLKFDIATLPMVMHFRIATSGNVDRGTTHPFPVSAKRKILRKTIYTTNLAIAHNGIIPITAPKNMSDTMEYTAKKLTAYQKVQADFYQHECYLKHIEKEIHSKMVFLDGAGQLAMIGEFVTEQDGMVYSNTSYMKRSYFSFHDYDSLFGYYATSLLCPIDGYLLDKSGRLIDCENELYLMDKYNHVYQYDFALDIAIKIEAEAFSYSGTPYIYDEEQAMYFDVEN